MRSSVIVITRNRSASIPETLQAISESACPDFELLVVDSSEGSEKENTARRVKDYGAKYIYEPRRGQSLARNTGLAQAGGEIIAFTDDDCIPARDWLANKVRNFSDAAVWGCSGRVVQHSREGAADLFEEVAGQDLGTERRVYTRNDIGFGIGMLLANATKVFAKHMKSSAPVPWCIGHGSSMAFRREVFERIGGLDERFGGGAPLKGCEDIEMFYRILKSGHTVVYEPTAVVRHKHRLSAEEVFKTRYIYSHSGAAMMRHYRKDPLMFFMFYGRLLQLVIKSAQYRLLRKTELARSFASDLRGFLDGWSAHRRLAKDRDAQPRKLALLPQTAPSARDVS
jgi:glycosyltransferase involved in cell wall biosynthesis